MKRKEKKRKEKKQKKRRPKQNKTKQKQNKRKKKHKKKATDEKERNARPVVELTDSDFYDDDDDAVEASFAREFPPRPGDDSSFFLAAGCMEAILTSIVPERSRNGDGNPCLIWTRKESRIMVGGKRTMCARFLYSRCVGEIAEGRKINQTCPRDKLCMQTAHWRTKLASRDEIRARQKRLYYPAHNEKRRETRGGAEKKTRKRKRKPASEKTKTKTK